MLIHVDHFLSFCKKGHFLKKQSSLCKNFMYIEEANQRSCYIYKNCYKRATRDVSLVIISSIFSCSVSFSCLVRPRAIPIFPMR